MLPAPYDSVAHKALTQMQDEFGDDLLGMLVTGSVARGDAMPASDLDCFVIIRSSWRQRRVRIIDGIVVELLLNPPEQMRREFTDADDPITIVMFAEGQMLYAGDETLPALVREAQSLMRRPRPSGDPQTLVLLRHHAADLLRDALDLVGRDEAAQALLCSLTVEAALDVHYRQQGWWPVTPKRLMQDLAQREPSLAALAHNALCEGTAETRYDALHHLVEHIMDSLPTEWETEPQRIS